MAIKYFCENPDCENYQKNLSMGKIRYRMVGNQLVPETKKCPACGSVLSVNEEIEPGPFKVNIGEFASMTPMQKSAKIKKRCEESMKREDAAGRKEEIKMRTIKKFLNR